MNDTECLYDMVFWTTDSAALLPGFKFCLSSSSVLGMFLNLLMLQRKVHIVSTTQVLAIVISFLSFIMKHFNVLIKNPICLDINKKDHVSIFHDVILLLTIAPFQPGLSLPIFLSGWLLSELRRDRPQPCLWILGNLCHVSSLRLRHWIFGTPGPWIFSPVSPGHGYPPASAA